MNHVSSFFEIVNVNNNLPAD